MSGPAGFPGDSSTSAGEVWDRLAEQPAAGPPGGAPRPAAALSIGAGVLSAVGCLVGLLAPGRIYGRETTTLADAATAQDLVGLVVVGPLLIVLAISALRGGRRAWLCWLGCLAFTVYNYAIYAFSVHFGPLFLAWVAVLGLSLFALIGGLTALLGRALVGLAGVRWVGWFLMGVAALFCLLWLREIVPDLLTGRPSTSAADWRVPTNPVHVLDLAFFLPAVFVSGLSLRRRRRLGQATAAGQLVFLALTCLPILVTPVVAEARGHTAVWSAVGPVGILFAATLLVLWRFLRAVPGTTAGRS
jgi:hypothetical protein